jgi:uncharacterized protein
LPTRRSGVLTPDADSWALVTGATSGIGAAWARELGRRGYGLLITGRREAELRAVARETGARAVEVLLAELSDEAALEGVVAACAGRRIDVLVNNAGFGTGEESFLRSAFEGQRRMERVHIAAPMRLIHAVAPGMVGRGTGVIVNVASLAAFMPLPRSAAYSATKAFLTVFSESLAMELRRSGVRVQALCPGFTRTHFHAALGIPEKELRNRFILRWMSAEAVVRASVRALRHDRVVCVPGFWNRVIRRVVPLVPRRLLYAALSGAR